MGDSNIHTPGTTNNDALLECLVILSEKFQRPTSRFALRASLSIDTENLTPQHFVQAAERIGISAKIVERPLNDLTKLRLPAVLLMHQNQACLLEKHHDDDTVEIRFPENPEAIVQKSIEELKKSYTGFAILIQPILENTKKSHEKEDIPFSSWFWGTLWHYRKSYVNILMATFLINLFTLASVLFIMNVYDRVVPTFATTTLWVLAIGILIIYIFDFLLRSLRGYVIDIIGKKSDILMGNQMFHHVLGMKLAAKPSSIGEFTNRMMEFEVIRDFFTSITLTTIVDWPFMILYLIVIMYIGGVIVLVPLTVIILVIAVMLTLEIPTRKLTKETVFNNSKKNAILVEALSGLETIKGLVAEGHVQKKWENHAIKAAKASQKSRFYSTLGVNTTNLAQQLVSACIVIAGVYQIGEGKLTLGGLIACTILGGRAIAPLGQIANIMTRFERAKMALKNLNKIMQTPTDREAGKQYIYRPKIEGELEFQNVSFGYPLAQGLYIPVLNDISFKIKGGEHVGLLGHMGSGKTTIHKLILGFYQPDKGAIYLDGIDIRQIDPADLRKYIGYIPQNNVLFSGTVRENIMVGNPTASLDLFLHAAKLTGVDKIIEHHPDGYDCFVGERGETLSGGQRQAIVIARSLISESSIYLMDEPTSVTDSQAELNILQRLQSYLSSRTLILTTHRAGLLNLVSRIMILQNGRLIMDGPREEVFQKLRESASKPAGTAS